MEGTSNQAPVIEFLARTFPECEFMVVDVGCSGGIDPIWRYFGSRLRALGIDPNLAEIERLRRDETYPGIDYLAARASLPPDHPFARRTKGRGYWSRSPWERLSVVKSNELMKDSQLSTIEMVAANRWSEMKLSDEVIVVPTYLRDRGTTNIDFLKIDVDGADFEILNSFDQALDTLVVLGVGIEINYFGSTSEIDHTFHNVDRFMKARGFELFGLTVRRYSVASLPSRYVWRFPAATEFGRPLQGDALYCRDLGSHEYDSFAARLPLTKLLNLICIFSAFNLPDCAAEIVLCFRDKLSPCCDAERLLDLLAAQAQWPTKRPLNYREYIRRFESHDPSFFPGSETASEDETCVQVTPCDTPAELTGDGPDGLREKSEIGSPPSPRAAKERDSEACLGQPQSEAARLHVEVAKAQHERDEAARRTSRELSEARRQLQEARDRIAAMKSSKFWKLRRIWFRLKRAVGVSASE